MKNPLLNISLRYLIPILLGVFVLSTQAFIYTSNKSRAFTNVRTDAVEDMRNQLNRAQSIIELLHKDATLLQVRTLVSSFGADAGHEVMILTDENNTVLASTSMKLINTLASLPTSQNDQDALSHIKASGGVEVFLSENGHKVNGYASVCGLSQSGHLRIDNCGILYLRNDITPALTNISGSLAEDAIKEGIGVLMLGLILWLVIHFSLTRRTQILINTAQSFSNGDYSARVHLDGNDELAVVSNAFDDMLDQVVDDRAALESSEDRLRKVFESVADGIIVYDKNGMVQAFNSACETIFIQSRNDIVGHSLANLVAPSKRSVLKAKRSKEGILETVGLRPDGSEFDMEMRLSEMPIMGEVQTIAIVRDVTERKRLENLKSEFTSIVSHELRTPITSIQGALGLILGGVTGELPDSLREMVDMCKRNSDRLLNLINDLLDMDKIASGKMEFNLAPLSSEEIVNEAVLLNQPYAKTHGITFRAECSTDASVLADSDRIHQVLSNLLSNAAKFSAPGDIVVLSAKQENSTIHFTVTDTGPGIPESYRKKIFDRFIQVENANTRKVAGTGLGLSISKSIVERHNGKIGVDSELGHGSTFWFNLPECDPLSATSPAPKKATG